MDNINWHYEMKGKQIGPIPEEVIRTLLEQGVINKDTHVWAQGNTEWRPLSDTLLVKYLTQMSTPPALPAGKISNVIVWILAFAPMLGLFLQAIIAEFFAANEYTAHNEVRRALVSGQYWYVTLILNIGLSLFDLKRLKQAGIHRIGGGWMVFIVPVYLWMRAKVCRQNQAYFWVWVAMFVLSILAV